MALNMIFLNSAKIAKVRAHDSSSKRIATSTSFGDLGRSHMTVAATGIEPSRSHRTGGLKYGFYVFGFSSIPKHPPRADSTRYLSELDKQNSG